MAEVALARKTVIKRRSPKNQNSIAAIEIAPNGDAYIAGTSMKVRYVVIESTELNRDEEAIRAEHDNLSIEQIRAALVYYATHKAEIDAEIRAEDVYVEDSRRSAKYQPSRSELRTRLRKSKIT